MFTCFSDLGVRRFLFYILILFAQAFAVRQVYAQCTTYSVGGGGTICSGAPGVAVTLSGSDVGVNYQLKRNGTNVGTAIPGTGSSLSWPNQTIEGTYSVFAAGGSCNNTPMNGSAMVTVLLGPIYNVTGGGTICGSQVRSVQLSDSDPGYTYQLRLNGSASGSAVQGTGSGLTWSSLSAGGTYIVTGTNSATGCTYSMNSSAVVTVNTPVAYTIAGAGTFCGQASATLSGSQTGVSYQLKRNGVNSGSAVSGTGSALSWTVTTSGTYTVVSTHTSSSCSITNPGDAAITINALPALYNVSGGGTICGAQVRSVQLSLSQTGTNYQLVLNGTDTGSPVTGTGSALTWPNLSAGGVYTVRATVATTGCSSIMNSSATITVNTPQPYTIGGAGTFCGQTPVTLSGSQTGVSYQLKKDGTNSGSSVSGTGSSLSWTVTSTGTYTLVATHTSSDCAATNPGSAVVTINPNPTLYNVGGGGIVCDQETENIYVSSQTGVNYQLMLDGVASGSAVPGTGSLLTWLRNTGGTYTVNAVNATTGCALQMNQSATIVNNTPAVYTVGGSGTFCCGQGVVTVSGSESSVVYELRRDGFPILTDITGTGAPISWSGLDDTGTYTVRASKTGTTCDIIFPTSASIIINPSPEQENLTGGGEICGDQSEQIQLSSNQANLSFQLRRNGQNFRVPQTGSGSFYTIRWDALTLPGNYSVVATNVVSGCSTLMDDSVTVVSNTPQIFSVSGGGGLCTTPTVTLSGPKSA